VRVITHNPGIIPSTRDRVLLEGPPYAFVALPGGLGTLDKLCEALTLVQTGTIKNFPIVLIGSAYWRPFTDMLHRMIAEGTLEPRDLRSFSSRTTWSAKNTARDVRRFTRVAELVAEWVPAGGRILELAPGPGYLAIADRERDPLPGDRPRHEPVVRPHRAREGSEGGRGR
jgi:hypothetical protein